MHNRSITLPVCLLLTFAAVAFGALDQQKWMVGGETRTALVWMPEATNPPPLVFVFHGHGGNVRKVARSFGIHDHWPEAAVVYMQGLPTPGRLTDPEGLRNGWNANPGDSTNRDLIFFDVVYAALKDKVDTNRVYSTGHSNGGAFTYCLWAARGDLFAAFAPSSAAPAGLVDRMVPKPVLHVAGKEDPLVKYAWQDAMMSAVRRLNHCSATGQPWASAGRAYRHPLPVR